MLECLQLLQLLHTKPRLEQRFVTVSLYAVNTTNYNFPRYYLVLNETQSENVSAEKGGCIFQRKADDDVTYPDFS